MTVFNIPSVLYLGKHKQYQQHLLLNGVGKRSREEGSIQKMMLPHFEINSLTFLG